MEKYNITTWFFCTLDPKVEEAMNIRPDIPKLILGVLNVIRDKNI